MPANGSQIVLRLPRRRGTCRLLVVLEGWKKHHVLVDVVIVAIAVEVEVAEVVVEVVVVVVVG